MFFENLLWLDINAKDEFLLVFITTLLENTVVSFIIRTLPMGEMALVLAHRHTDGGPRI